MVLRHFILFIFLCSFFQVAHARIEYQPLGGQATGQIFSSGQAACTATFPQYPNITYRDRTSGQDYQLYGDCMLNGGVAVSVKKITIADCPSQGTSIGIKQLNWNGKAPDNWSPPAQVCIDKCQYNFIDPVFGYDPSSNTTGAAGEAISTGNTCTVNTDGQDIPYSCDKDVCDVPPNQDCPPTHTKGTFDGKTICSKNPDDATCTPTILDPYKCMKDQEPKPSDPDANGNCTAPKIKVYINGQAQCTDKDAPPRPDGTCPANYIKQTVNGQSKCIPNNQAPDNGLCPIGTTKETVNGVDSCKKNGSGDDENGSSNSKCSELEAGTWQKTICEALSFDKDVELPDDPKVKFKDLDLPDIDTQTIDWSSQCPSEKTFTLSFGQRSQSFTFSYEKICNAFVTASPWVRAFAWLSATYILIGAVRK